jgi:hypothetical protein
LCGFEEEVLRLKWGLISVRIKREMWGFEKVNVGVKEGLFLTKGKKRIVMRRKEVMRIKVQN